MRGAPNVRSQRRYCVVSAVIAFALGVGSFYIYQSWWESARFTHRFAEVPGFVFMIMSLPWSYPFSNRFGLIHPNLLYLSVAVGTGINMALAALAITWLAFRSGRGRIPR